MSTTTTQIRAAEASRLASIVPPTPGELAASAQGRWERRGFLQRLVRVN